MQALELKIPPPLITLVTGSAMWGISLFTPSMDIPGVLHVSLVAAVAMIGMVFALAGIVSFRVAKTTINPHRPEKAAALVCNGIYKITRNPMYVGLVFTLIAWAIFLSSRWSLLGVVAFVLYIGRFQIGPEERALEAIFGRDYLEYKARVRRWL